MQEVIALQVYSHLQPFCGLINKTTTVQNLIEQIKGANGKYKSTDLSCKFSKCILQILRDEQLFDYEDILCPKDSSGQKNPKLDVITGVWHRKIQLIMLVITKILKNKGVQINSHAETKLSSFMREKLRNVLKYESKYILTQFLIIFFFLGKRRELSNPEGNKVCNDNFLIFSNNF